MKTAVSIPDHVFARAEQAARSKGFTRSELFTRALVFFLDKGLHTETEQIRRIDAVVKEVGPEYFVNEDLKRAQLGKLADEGW